MTCRLHRETINVSTSERFDVIDVTGQIEHIVEASDISKGILHAYTPHTTAAITINEAEPGLIKDLITYIKELTKPGYKWMHNRIDNNAHAHLGQSTYGHSVTVPVEGGRLMLGTWQRILLVEMDGPRTRKIIVTVLGVD
ncbi:MAG: secondary thiamine-phosphate synthase enzyme YjbQ [Desulfurococcales archaeon]|nr:secondary thiamine-phosphate synthase enzyme YjbQ [Desulfurococcales archaeon]MCE4622178.1 secondary thiamine-phosphate synthase enzyme YjbQ [Desulfurococcales archaeon]MCE4626085.1 secondary thiamine-phosphate synthase enzyme YjbQ [Desulfurococcales archaeon]MCE4629850.1 secondary thiamine-phosphate synthase enzyme YjbQ [Desulfurococcales archaeon]